MTTAPRLLFTAFPDAQVKAAMWSGHADLLLGSPRAPLALPSGPFTIWQLVTANGRAVARATQAFASFDDASRDARRVVREAPKLTIDLVTNAATGMHGWSARLDGECVAVCSRWYSNERDCRNAGMLAVESFPIARVSTSAHVARLFRGPVTSPVPITTRRNDG